jgi:anti-sigma factor RsiW
MACDVGREKLDAYLDGELTSTEASVLSAHLRGCNSCAPYALERTQLKRAIATAGKRYHPSTKFREKIAKVSGAKIGRAGRRISWGWIVAAPAIVVLIISIAVNSYLSRENADRQRVYSELADLHVATLASATRVDVLSTDRHTVKPWFQGKIPFTFNLPELQGTEFTLIGGRVAYLAQNPGAQLMYQISKHEISVFIFQDRGTETANFPSGVTNALSFNTDAWTQNGLRYFVIGDVSPGEIQTLSKLLQDAR